MRSMIRICSLFLLLIGPMSAGAQSVVQGEYFFNSDPGLGMATPFSFTTPADSVEESLEISTADLLPGRHLLYTRLKDDLGIWGITNKREVYLNRLVVGAEYFWDVDPGNGNGTPLLVYDGGGSPTICDKVSTAGLLPGIHSLYVRYRSADGVWAIPSRSDVTIVENETPIGCNGDFDNNGTINASDLLIFLGGFSDAFNCELDLTDDFTVNTSDLLLFLGAFGGVCP